MKALAMLGLQLNENIPLDIHLGENFNGSLYGLTRKESVKVRALRQVGKVMERAICTREKSQTEM